MNTETCDRITAEGEAAPLVCLLDSIGETPNAANPNSSIPPDADLRTARDLIETALRALSEADSCDYIRASDENLEARWQAVDPPLREALILVASDPVEDTQATNYPEGFARDGCFLFDLLRDTNRRLRMNSANCRKLAAIDITEVLRNLPLLIEKQRWNRSDEGRAAWAKAVEENRRKTAEWLKREAQREADLLQRYPSGEFGLALTEPSERLAVDSWALVLSIASDDLNTAENSARSGNWLTMIAELRGVSRKLNYLLAALEEAERKAPGERSAAEITRRFYQLCYADKEPPVAKKRAKPRNKRPTLSRPPVSSSPKPYAAPSQPQS